MMRSAFQFLKPVTRLSISLRALSHVPVDDRLFGLSDEERELRQTARSFFESELGDLAFQIDKDDHFPGFRDYMKK